MNTYKMFCTILLSLTAVSAFAEPQSYVAVDNGYRWDNISNRASLGGSTISVKGSTQSLRRINSYQLGIIGQWTYCNAFVKGYTHYGWVGDGHYQEGGFSGKANGHTYDLQAAIGYSFCATPSISFSPVIGVSLDALNLTGSHIHTVINGRVLCLNGIRAHQRFSGPFLGFDLQFQVNPCLDFIFGYELHYAHWHGQRKIHKSEYGNPPFGASTGFSNQRHLDSVWGQVFTLDTTYQLCDCWLIGLKLKYQFYNGDSGRYKQTKKPLISQFTYAKVDGLWWSSFASTIYIGRTF